MKKLYHTAGALIVACWLALMAVLVMRQAAAFRPVQLEKQFLSTAVESRQEWSGIYLKDSKVGYSRSAIKRIEEGYQISEEVFLDLTVMDMPQKIQTRVNAVVDGDMRMQLLNFRLSSGAISMSVSGTVQGRRLKLHIRSGSASEFRTISLNETPVLSNSLRYFVLKQGIKPGMTYAYPFFDPLTLSTRTMQVHVLAKEPVEIHGRRHDCFKVQSSFQGMSISSWVNDQGETLREESPMGLVLVREDQQTALEGGWGKSQPDITSATAIKVNTAFSAKGVSFLKLRLKNAALDGFSLNSGRQRLTGDILEIRQEQVGGAGAVHNTDDLERYVQPSAFIQSDSPAIIDIVNQQPGNDKKSAAIVRSLVSWVFKNIEKKPTLSVPSALAVLETRQGDCNEHAVLLAALCRAAGIPCRVAAGLVHVNGSFYYHAWCEVYLGAWITADATMDQFPADVSHVKFVEGDTEDQIAILKLIGKLEIDVLEFR